MMMMVMMMMMMSMVLPMTGGDDFSESDDGYNDLGDDSGDDRWLH